MAGHVPAIIFWDDEFRFDAVYKRVGWVAGSETHRSLRNRIVPFAALARCGFASLNPSREPSMLACELILRGG
jgi:hypothetical protein